MRLRESNEVFNYKRAKLQLFFEEFLNSGMEQAEVIYDPTEYTSTHTMHSSLYEGARRWTKGAVAVLFQKGRVFLVRKDR